MNLPLPKEQHAAVIESIRRFAAEEWDLEVSTIRAGALLEYFLKEIAPLAYNHGVEDARAQVARLAEDLPGNCFEEPLRYWEKDSPSRAMRRKPER